MPVQDRTTEFHTCVESIRNRSSLPRAAEQKQRLLQGQGKESSKSEFSSLASAIAKDINGTTVRLGKLAQCECLIRQNTLSLIVEKWQNARRCLMIVPSKLAYVSLNQRCLSNLTSHNPGIDLHNQTRYRRYQQTDSWPADLCQAAQHPRVRQVCRGKAS